MLYCREILYFRVFTDSINLLSQLAWTVGSQHVFGRYGMPQKVVGLGCDGDLSDPDVFNGGRLSLVDMMQLNYRSM